MAHEMHGEWENGLCSHVCGSETCGMCLGSWFCSCFLYGRTAERLSNFPSDETPELFNGPCFIMYASACVYLHWLPPTLKRIELRKKFGIKGNGCVDCLAASCCMPCVLGQMETEVKSRAAMARQGGPQAGYSQPTGGMTYQAPGQENGYAAAPVTEAKVQ